ncbi:MAG: flagellar protein FlgN [Erythrobacter sp.]|jgi:hypothetical protein|nr:flagellar protein FlgN [Erythrobacter sp.]
MTGHKIIGHGQRSGPAGPSALAGQLRQMIAVLEAERQALATLDADALICAANEKAALCDALQDTRPELLDAHTRPLAETARQLNEVNRQVRNLLAANVAARLRALGRLERVAAGPGASGARYGDAFPPSDPHAAYRPAR